MALTDGSLIAPGAEDWEATGGGGGWGEGRAEEEEIANQTKETAAAAAGRGGDAHAQLHPAFVERHDDDGNGDNSSEARLLPSRSGVPPGDNDGGDVIAAKNSSLPGQAVRGAVRQEAKAGSGAEGEEQEATESGGTDDETLTQPLLASTAPAWN